MTTVTNLSRRDFLTGVTLAGAALTLGCQVESADSRVTAAGGAALAPNAFLTIHPDGRILITVNKTEMGQGVRTGLPMLVAEELDADWSAVTVETASFDPSRYGFQGTGGSGSLRGAWEPLRRTGATARAMLVEVAARRWNVAAADCRTEAGYVLHPSDPAKKLSYGELVADAAALPAPDPKTVKLKDPKDFRLIGRRVARYDNPDIVTGKAVYGMDVRQPDMRFATMVHAPVFGGKPKQVDDQAAKAIPGVEQVFVTDRGVAVVATNTWAAFEGAKKLRVTWDDGPHAELSSASIRAMFAEKAKVSGDIARNDGDAESALAQAAKRLEAIYEVPFLHHATLEPQNCTARVTAESCEIWAPTQFPNFVLDEARRITGLDAARIKIHVTLLGGGFGRRIEADYAADAVEVAKRLNGRPVQVTWTREEDMQHGWYRPASLHVVKGGLSEQGQPVAILHRLVAPSIRGQRQPDGGKGVDPGAMAGISSMQYDVPNFRAEYVRANTGVPIGFWRAVFDSQNAFVQESWIDELAHAAQADPVAFRLKLLGKSPRLKQVLDVAAKAAGWGKPLPKGQARGVAAHFSFGAFCAQVAEVSIEDDLPRIHRVVCAMDVGTVVNPSQVEAQIEGSIVFALSAALYGAITVEKGRVVQSNFNDYPLLRLGEMPKVEVHLIQSGEAPSGAGEPALPPTAPAVCNALFALTGKRIRKLPIELDV
ncbi:MAG: xanthine dehydrogenase family protein molybdopterin-binding subunit [Chloracidobacterium sp.]